MWISRLYIFNFSNTNGYFSGTEYSGKFAKAFRSERKIWEWNVKKDAVCISISNAGPNGCYKKLWISRRKRRYVCENLLLKYNEKLIAVSTNRNCTIWTTY